MSAQDPSSIHLDFSYLRDVAQGDAAQERQILQMVVEELADRPPLLQQSCAQRNWPQIVWHAHHFKNTLFFVGDKTLETLNNQLLDTARRALDAESSALDSLLIQIVERSRQTRLVLLQLLG